VTLLLTHTHWDHIQGLPFFLPVYRPQNQLKILGYEGARHVLHNVLTSQMESPFFPIGLKEVPANVQIEELKELEFKVGKVRVRACRASHPGSCVGYRLFTSSGSVAFFPDNELHHNHNRQSSNQKVQSTSPLQNQDQDIVKFLEGTDILIMDAQYDRVEYEHHIGWGHGRLDDVVALALEAGVKRLWLFHHDPDHDDAKIDAMVGYARELASAGNSALEIDAAREGTIVELGD